MKKNNESYAKNTFILLLGKFSSQLVSFLLLPIYTRYLITSDYGYVDLAITYVLLLTPVLSLRLDSATFRLLVDCRKDEEKKSIYITNIIYILIYLFIFSIVLGAILFFLLDFKYSLLIIFATIISFVYGVFLQLFRGMGMNAKYSFCSIIVAIANLISNILLICILKMNASSILISLIISNLVGLIYILISFNLNKSFKKKYINKNKIKEILAFSLPMIPNALSWWVINTSDRTIITLFLGATFNAIYSISCKFSNILNSVFDIFNMSWQEIASLHINDENKEEFFSNLIKKIFMVFSSFSLMIVICLPFVYDIIIGSEYYSSYNYIPIILFANLLNVLSGLLGGLYIALKKTKEIALTTIYSGIINIVVHLLLVKYIGIYAAIISTIISYLVIFIYRYIDIRKYVKVKLPYITIIVIFTVLGISTTMYLINNVYLNIFNLVLTLLFIIIYNRKDIKNYYNIILNKIKK